MLSFGDFECVHFVIVLVDNEFDFRLCSSSDILNNHVLVDMFESIIVSGFVNSGGVNDGGVGFILVIDSDDFIIVLWLIVFIYIIRGISEFGGFIQDRVARAIIGVNDRGIVAFIQGAFGDIVSFFAVLLAFEKVFAILYL